MTDEHTDEHTYGDGYDEFPPPPEPAWGVLGRESEAVDELRSASLHRADFDDWRDAYDALCNRRRRFLYYVLAGEPLYVAALQAGWCSEASEATRIAAAKRQASQVLREPVVAWVLQEQNYAALKRAGSKREALVRKLCAIAYARIDEFLRWDSNGRPEFRDMSRIDVESLACIQTFEYSEAQGQFGLARKVKFQLKDSLRAIELLARMHGFLQPQADPVDAQLDNLVQSTILAINEMTVASPQQPAAGLPQPPEGRGSGSVEVKTKRGKPRKSKPKTGGKTQAQRNGERAKKARKRASAEGRAQKFDRQAEQQKLALAKPWAEGDPDLPELPSDMQADE